MNEQYIVDFKARDGRLKREALLQHLHHVGHEGAMQDDIVALYSDADGHFTHGDDQYFVVTELELDGQVFQNFLSRIHELEPKMLATYTGLPETVFEILNVPKYARIVVVLIRETCGMKAVLDAAVKEKGRAYYAAGVDEEYHYRVDGHSLYVYCANALNWSLYAPSVVT